MANNEKTRRNLATVNLTNPPKLPFIWTTTSAEERRLIREDRNREFRREYLGEFIDHRPDSLVYSRRAIHRELARGTPNPRSGVGGFMLVSPALAGELEPDAVVQFDQELAAKVADPVFITRWGHLYVASLASHHVCWCWNGEKWDDLTGGFWTEPHERAWMDCLALARAIAGDQ